MTFTKQQFIFLLIIFGMQNLSASLALIRNDKGILGLKNKLIRHKIKKNNYDNTDKCSNSTNTTAEYIEDQVKISANKLDDNQEKNINNLNNIINTKEKNIKKRRKSICL